MLTDDTEKLPELIACGILKREIKYLVNKNKWPVKVKFLDSSLHIDLDKLSRALKRILSKSQEKRRLLVYGTCHPQMDNILQHYDVLRTPGQNCVELLLGRQRFSSELSKGAFFLFEDWANRWETISYNYFGSWEIMKEVFQDAHKYLLCIKTPCSGNFEKSANQVNQRLGLPIIWEDFGLNNLEAILKKDILKLLERSSQ